MECKFCAAQVDDGETVCPNCGKDLREEIAEDVLPEEVPAETPEQVPQEVTEDAAEEQVREAQTEEEQTEQVQTEEALTEETAQQPQKKNTGKTVAFLLGGILIALVLIGAVLYALGVDLRPGGKGILSKDNYIVSDEQGIKAADQIVATAGDRTLTNAELQIYYCVTVNNFFSYYGNYLAMVGIDQTTPLEEQIYDATTGQTWQQYLLEMALGTWHRYASLNLMAQEDEFQLDAATQAQLDNMLTDLEASAPYYGFENAQQMLTEEFGPVCNADGYLRYVAANTTGMEYYNIQYEKMEPTDEQVKAFFDENAENFSAQGITADSGRYVDVRHILFCPEGGTTDENGKVTYSEEEWEACRQKAQDLLDQWAKGDATQDSFAALAGEYSEDGGSVNNGGLYTQVYVGQMVEPFENWCFDESRQYGDTGLVQTNYGYHIMYFVDGYDIWYYNAKSELITDMTNKLVETGMQRWPMEVDYKKIVIGDIFGTNAQTAETTPATE